MPFPHGLFCAENDNQSPRCEFLNPGIQWNLFVSEAIKRLAEVPKFTAHCTLYNIEIGEAQLMDSNVVVLDASVAHARAPMYRKQSSCNSTLANTLCLQCVLIRDKHTASANSSQQSPSPSERLL